MDEMVWQRWLSDVGRAIYLCFGDCTWSVHICKQHHTVIPRCFVLGLYVILTWRWDVVTITFTPIHFFFFIGSFMEHQLCQNWHFEKLTGTCTFVLEKKKLWISGLPFIGSVVYLLSFFIGIQFWVFSIGSPLYRSTSHLKYFSIACRWML